jgi:hypothetical protein
MGFSQQGVVRSHVPLRRPCSVRTGKNLPMGESLFDGHVIAWANVELTKNAAEIGYARFLYAVRSSSSGTDPR